MTAKGVMRARRLVTAMVALALLQLPCSVTVGQPLLLSEHYPELIAAARRHYSEEPPEGQNAIVLSGTLFPKNWNDSDFASEEYQGFLNAALNGPTVDFQQVKTFVPAYEYTMSFASIAPFAYSKKDVCELHNLARRLIRLRHGKPEKTDLFRNFQATRKAYGKDLYALQRSKSPTLGLVTPVLDAHYQFVTRGKKFFVQETLGALDKLWRKDPHVRWSDYRSKFWSNRNTGRLQSGIVLPLRSPELKWLPLLRDAALSVDMAEIEIKRQWFSIEPFTVEKWTWSSGAPHGAAFVLTSSSELTPGFDAVPLRMIAIRSAASPSELRDGPINLIGYVANKIPKLPQSQQNIAH